MFTLILLIFSIFSPSFQTINTGFFCEDELKETYLEDPVTKKLTQIGYGPTDGIWSTPSRIPDLAAAPGDILVFRCYSYKDLDVCVGGGCFLINDICRCYSFKNHLAPAWYVSLSTTIEGKPCNSFGCRRSSMPKRTINFSLW